MKRLILLLLVLFTAVSATAQGSSAREFRPVADSLKARLQRRTTVLCNLKIDKVLKRGNVLDFYFSQELVDYPWRSGDIEWFQDQLRELMPADYRAYSLGEIYGKKTRLETLPMPELHRDGKPARSSALRIKDPRRATAALVRDEDDWPMGLSGRHIALWQSHGRYYEQKTGRWEWQRAATHRTVEDLYTQSYVLPFLMPMLENAGAVVMSPRERDTQVHEVVCDNDPSFEGPREGLLRRKGRYKETGTWTDAGIGFADAKAVYSGYDNPFLMGTARACITASADDPHRRAEAVWRPTIPARGDYAVYVSYKTLPNSTTDATYTIIHDGGTSYRHVNQRMGGGMWIYLGTFPFAEGTDGCVKLSNRSDAGGVVTADAVRFGGGMGKVERGGSISGFPAYVEGALYGLQWAGFDLSLFDQWEDDYTKDYAGRGRWVTRLSAGSRTNPNEPGGQIPFDLSLAFHSDAGVTPNDSIVGTLAIYTLLCENSDKLPDGENRLNGRALCDAVQTQVVSDIRAQFNPLWSRRGTWDRSYSESRTTSVPGMLLELLSHQNFADMKYGLDPSFRFSVSRAVYKGVLKYLSNRYGCAYSVQPLPVKDFSVTLEEGKAVLSWAPAEDPLEPTATPEGYIVYTRREDGSFDGGVRVSGTSWSVPLRTGELTSFKVVAFNQGGKSFPSEILSAGIPTPGARPVLVVNNFTRVSAPAWYDTPAFAGFADNLDSGVPWGQDILVAGMVNEFDRSKNWTDDDNPGFGGSFTDLAGRRIGGNTFDFPAWHGRALMDAGYAFASVSLGAFTRMDASAYDAVDLICGKQVTTRIGSGAIPDRYEVFPAALQSALRRYTQAGGSVLLSGAYIGTDAWDRVYPVTPDPGQAEKTRTFIQEVLGYRWVTNFGDNSGALLSRSGAPLQFGDAIRYNREFRPDFYRVENPDGIAPASDKAQTILLYSGSLVPAATVFDSGSYRVAAFGFPLESVTDPVALQGIFRLTLKYLVQNF